MSGGKLPCHSDAPALVMAWPCHSRHHPGDAAAVSQQAEHWWWSCHGWVGDTASSSGYRKGCASSGWQTSWWAGPVGKGRVAAPLLLLFLCITAGYTDEDATRPQHAPVVSLWRVVKALQDREVPHTYPIMVLQGAGNTPEPWAEGAQHPFTIGSQGLTGPHMISWHHPWWRNGLVTVGRTLGLAKWAGRGVSWPWEKHGMDSLGMRLGGKGSPWRWRVAVPIADSAVLWQPQLWIWE